ncbi:hypothetical protein [Streptomyces mirabilis]|uniref:hypothetical protein n=1 Tax=Streptomyces mirabilis TaxID=68239 RepID=UPI003825BD90
MILVTEEQVQQAEVDAERAEEVLHQANKRYARGAGTVRGYEDHQEAIRRAEHARTRLATVRGDFEAQAVVRAAHAELAKETAKELAPAVRKLDKSREAAVGALAGAEAAIVQALEALGAYDELVREASRELLGRGLRGEYGEEISGLLDGSVIAQGEQWRPCDGAGLLLAVLTQAVKAAGVRHWLSALPQGSYVGISQQAATREFLDRLVAKRG